MKLLQGMVPKEFCFQMEETNLSVMKECKIFQIQKVTPSAKFLSTAADELSTSVLDHRKSIVEMVVLAQNFDSSREFPAFHNRK